MELEDIKEHIKGKLFKIKVRTIEGNNLIFRNVKHYLIDNGLIFFTDINPRTKVKKPKVFTLSNIELEYEESNIK